MLLERTISQLNVGPMPADQAEALGHMGYLQWLGALPGGTNYTSAAKTAREAARPFKDTSPAVAVFCRLLSLSLAEPLKPLVLRAPVPQRRGGARARRRAVNGFRG